MTGLRGTIRRALLPAMLALSACQQAPTMNAARVVPIRQLDDPGACATATPPAQALNDRLGWQWFENEGSWCRRQLETGTAQAWTQAQAQDDASHRLHIDGGNVGLTDALPVLQRLEAGQAASGTCEDSRRMRAFRDQNWLIQRGDLDCRGYRATSRQVLRPIDLLVGGQRVPVLMSQPDVPEDRGTIIFLPGGPYGNLVRGLDGYALTSHFLAAYGADTAVLIPAYAGTDKLRVGENDLARATAEIDAVIAYARERRRPICVVGYGLGAYAVAPLVGRNIGNGFLFLAPMTSTPAGFVDRLKANGVQPTKLQLVEGLPTAHRVDTTSDAALLRYAGDAARQDLATRLGAAPLTNVEMAYAPDDPVVGPRDLGDLAAKLGTARMHRVTPVGHAVENPMSFMAYQPALDRFLGSCLANPAN